ncbi:MAG TPA: PhzF family phenazine biosynthesis isomerase [Solirubrobacteraceae bacterium]|nr:PhzF family phenazine biosynthesis isomerase [Solirubrobacteraceae bacterium]
MNATSPQILRLVAFTEDPAGGNPAGVVPDARGLDAAAMQAIAADVGFSETAFLVPASDDGVTFDVRYFSPQAEVPFCGHATIASAVAVGSGDGAGRTQLLFRTAAGEVPVAVEAGRAALSSVAPHVEELSDADLDVALALLRWSREDLEPALPPRIAYAGARHLILAAATRDRLARLDYDFDGLRAFMLERDLTTVDLVFRESASVFHARNPFPVGGVVEDPATGAAAAAFGGYLRELALVAPPTQVTVHQGHDMGRPSTILIDIPADDPSITVSGAAVPMA